MSVRRAIVLVLVLALLVPLVARAARADVPGTIPLVAGGGSHVWWVVEAVPGSTSGAPAQAEAPFLLMHHAVDEPAPTERLVLRLAQEPEAIAADGTTLFIVARPEGGRKRLVTSTTVRKNPAVGHWFDGPPRAHAPLDPEGELRDLVAVGGRLYALLRRPSAALAERERLRLVGLDAAGGAWEEVALPDLELGEPFRLFGADSALGAIGRDGSGVPTLARLGDDGRWTSVGIGEAVGSEAPPSGVSADLSAIEVDGRTVLVERLPPLHENGPGSLRLTIARSASRSPWATFPEPYRPWALVGFGPDALLLVLNVERRGVAARVRFAESTPDPPVELAPPGFGSRGWVHLPIIGILSVALSLAAVLFGSEAYLHAGRRGEAPPVRPRGVSFGQRASAWAIDLVPGVAIAWAIFGGNPIELLQVPAFIADLPSEVPALVAVGVAWAIAALGDVVFGRSLGKRVVGLEIISARGGPSTPLRRLVRSIASAICVASPVVLLLALLQPNRDGPAEMVSGTALVEVPLGQGAEGASGGRSEGDESR